MLFDQPCAIVDLETTGGHITRDRITEIGIVLVDGKHVERYSTLVNPGQPIPPFIEKMTGISNDMVADAPSFESLAEEVLAKLQGRLFIAHNARFDYGFLKNAFKRIGLKFQTEVLCSVKLSRKLYPQHYKHNLDSLIERHGIVLEERHRALADAEAVWAFLQSARDELTESVMEETAGVLLARPMVPEGIDPEVVDNLPDVPGVFLFYDENDLPLLAGRTGNLRSGVLGYFSGEHRPGKEVRLSQQVKRIEWQETVGEFGAMLLEQ
ncbi:MAG: ethanolamine utilization protein, partial [Burkholderiaceae bacterium]|nr:ethanolamine utilization protein [Burkholderiaceae bacterium]